MKGMGEGDWDWIPPEMGGRGQVHLFPQIHTQAQGQISGWGWTWEGPYMQALAGLPGSSFLLGLGGSGV